MMRPTMPRRRRSALTATAALLSVVALAAPILIVPAAGAQQPGAVDATGYSPCEEGESDIDLLVMMDASGSLNSPGSGLDPDGSQRRQALSRFRADLTSVLRDLPQDSSTRVRVSLWRFESSVRQIAPFDVPSASHPSNAQIEESLGDIDGGRLAYRRNHTDYLQALREAEGAFRAASPPGACRLLLFFTDGLYDPLGRMTLEQADELREEVCGRIKQNYLDADIDVYSILLGSRFLQSRTGPAEADVDEVETEMLAASLQIMRALTGHGDSPLVRGLPPALRFDCEHWSDEIPEDRTGAIITIEDLDRLSVQLLEVAEVAARGLVEWTNCGVAPDGGTRSGPLPAGRYIESIVAYPRDSLIDAYQIVTADGGILPGRGSRNAPLRLDSDDLEGLAAGWTIEFITDGAGGGIDVACYAKLASAETSVTSGTVTDADGNEPGEVVRSPDGPGSAPQTGYQIVADAPLDLCSNLPDVWPDERVRDAYCRQDRAIVFELHPLDCEAEYRFDKPLRLLYEPEYANSLFLPGQLSQEIRIDIDRELPIRYDCFGAPVLVCTPDGDPRADERTSGDFDAGRGRVPELALSVAPDTRELPRERLRGDTDCRLYPPHVGEVEVSASWYPDSSTGAFPGEIDWRFRPDAYGDGSDGYLDASQRVLRLGPAEVSDGVPLLFETVDELDNGDWHITGVIELTPRWVTGFEDPQLEAQAQQIMAEQRVNVRADQEYTARANSAAALSLTLLLLILSALLSYILFCLALAATASLPDPNGFWLYSGLLPVEAGASGSFAFGDGARSALEAMQAERIEGVSSGRRNSRRWKTWRGQSIAGGSPLEIRLRRAWLFWLPGLLRESWSEVRVARGSGDGLAARPVGRRVPRDRQAAGARAHFDVLEVVGSARRTGGDDWVAPVWLARPRHGPKSGVDQTDLGQLAMLLNETGDAGDVRTADSSSALSPMDAGDPAVAPDARPSDAPPPDRPDLPPPNSDRGPSR